MNLHALKPTARTQHKFYLATQVLTTRAKLKTTKDAYPEVHANRRKTRHRFLPKTSNASNSTLPNSALIQDLRWVAIERAKLGESNATKIIKNRGWKRRKSTVESYGEQ
ncbi:receptor-like protein kinase-like [Dorcoceras hygrometricum]|uniref:Receptor-like protein kinase-like n=1 Tax=Dorcoceras hygrometricum TaxID=472368 RepID=A0A2Z6ZWD0_9LAMI|nr:receptor-like protein kinase-like [Dorcoceras hygrometricum]